jgi:hypothetical protein
MLALFRRFVRWLRGDAFCEEIIARIDDSELSTVQTWYLWKRKPQSKAA